MPANPLNTLLRAGEGAAFRRLERLTAQVNVLESDTRELSDDELREQTDILRQRHADGESLDHLLPEAFAAVREASARVLGKRHFDVQIMGGAALHLGNVAEMKTGQGKAVTAETLLPTPKGWVAAKDVEVGSDLMGPDGLPAPVTGVYPQGVQPVWTVRLGDGRTLDCNAEHLWTVIVAGIERTITTREIMVFLDKGDLVSLPRHEPVQWQWAQPERSAEEMARLCGNPRDAWRALRDLPAFEGASLEQRRDLLRALLSDPTTYQRNGDCLVISLTYSAIRSTINSIARSLGIEVVDSDSAISQWTIGRELAALLGEEFTAPESHPLIVSVTPTSRSVEQVCFTVANDSHLFLAGDFIVTHNTLTAVLPGYLNALSGKGVHVVTVNDYLASEQAEQMSRVYHALGMSVGCILADMSPAERQAEYAKDVTYGTNNEFGFDYLRDNTAWDPESLVQRGHNFVIVDEIDSILIDEARTPLILSQDGDPKDPLLGYYKTMAQVAPYLERTEKDPKTGDLIHPGDFTVDEKKRTATLTEQGIDTIEDLLGISNLYDPENALLVSFIDNAIAARALYLNKRDYIVEIADEPNPQRIDQREVKIIDEHTGRILSGRRYNEGLHQALEAKEGIEPRPATLTTGRITLQNYFRLYDKLSGMTGTGQSEAAEFYSVYGLGVIPIPTNKPPQRVDHHDRIYLHEQAKFAAAVREVAEIHTTGQPILVGTTSVEKSEYLSGLLQAAGIPHDVLNAKQHEREASIVAQAGRRGAVTVSTNMAGRGTDIILGGNAEHRTMEALRIRGLDAEIQPEAYEAAWQELLPKLEAEVASEHAEVVDLGGLYVMGTERHESRRIDDQLRGRSGRQGDPGASRFLLSLEDDLMKRFNPTMVARVMSSSDDTSAPLESKMLTRVIASAQRQAEGQNAEIRKEVLKYDDVLSAQREVIYRDRQRILMGHDSVVMTAWIRAAITDLAETYLFDPVSERWQIDEFWHEVTGVVPLSILWDDILAQYGGLAGLTQEDVILEITSDACYAYDARFQTQGENLVRMAALSRIDALWPIEIESLDELRQSVGLRSLAQKDPLTEYQREAAEMFRALIADIHRESVQAFFGGEQEVRTENALTAHKRMEAENVAL